MTETTVFGESCTAIAAELAAVEVAYDGPTACVTVRAAPSGPLMRAMGRAVAAELMSDAMAGGGTLRTQDQRRADAFVALITKVGAGAGRADPLRTT